MGSSSLGTKVRSHRRCRPRCANPPPSTPSLTRFTTRSSRFTFHSPPADKDPHVPGQGSIPSGPPPRIRFQHHHCTARARPSRRPRVRRGSVVHECTSSPAVFVLAFDLASWRSRSHRPPTSFRVPSASGSQSTAPSTVEEPGRGGLGGMMSGDPSRRSRTRAGKRTIRPSKRIQRW